MCPTQWLTPTSGTYKVVVDDDEDDDDATMRVLSKVWQDGVNPWQSDGERRSSGECGSRMALNEIKSKGPTTTNDDDTTTTHPPQQAQAPRTHCTRLQRAPHPGPFRVAHYGDL